MSDIIRIFAIHFVKAKRMEYSAVNITLVACNRLLGGRIAEEDMYYRIMITLWALLHKNKYLDSH